MARLAKFLHGNGSFLIGEALMQAVLRTTVRYSFLLSLVFPASVQPCNAENALSLSTLSRCEPDAAPLRCLRAPILNTVGPIFLSPTGFSPIPAKSCTKEGVLPNLLPVACPIPFSRARTPGNHQKQKG